MDEKRKGEIALILLKQQFKKRGFHFNPEELGNLARETRVPPEELKEFAKFLIEELLSIGE